MQIFGEKANLIPNGWSQETVGSLYKLIGGGTPSTKIQEYWNGEIPWITSADIHGLSQIIPRRFINKKAIENSTTNLVPKNSIIVVTRVSLGKLAIANSALCFSQDSQALIDKLDGQAIFPLYALYYLSVAVQEFKHKNRGTTINGVTKKQLSDLQFLVPPLAEQQRIVDKIEELLSDLDSGIDSLKTAQQQLKVYRQAVLKWAFEGKLTAQWREEQKRQGKLESADTLLAQIKAEREQRYQKELESWKAEVEAWEAIGKEGRKPRKPSKSTGFCELTNTDLKTLPDLPENWFYIRAEGISDFITKGTTPKKGELFELEGDIPFVKVYNLTHKGTLDFSINPTFVSQETHRGFLGRSRVLPDDVLMNIVGPPLGKVSLVPNSFSEWNINQAIVRYRLLDNLSSKYFVYYLLSQVTIDRMSGRAKATAGQFNLTLEICRDAEVPVCSKAEQRQIVEEIESRLSICDQLEADIEANLQKAEALRQSILKQAFEGKLVPQDPNDEPASILLERIRAEREAAKQTQKSKSRQANAKEATS